MTKISRVLCLMGDGSTNIGYFHESLNMSAVWDLPVVWLIENNQYGMGTAVNRASGQDELKSTRSVGYDMKEWNRIDGMNVVEVYEEIGKALDYARKHGPVLVEVDDLSFSGALNGRPRTLPFQGRNRRVSGRRPDWYRFRDLSDGREGRRRSPNWTRSKQQILEEMEAVTAVCRR